jgi:hypothetical protein
MSTIIIINRATTSTGKTRLKRIQKAASSGRSGGEQGDTTTDGNEKDRPRSTNARTPG